MAGRASRIVRWSRRGDDGPPTYIAIQLEAGRPVGLRKEGSGLAPGQREGKIGARHSASRYCARVRIRSMGFLVVPHKYMSPSLKPCKPTRPISSESGASAYMPQRSPLPVRPNPPSDPIYSSLS
jgi:hypothetical protein